MTCVYECVCACVYVSVCVYMLKFVYNRVILNRILFPHNKGVFDGWGGREIVCVFECDRERQRDTERAEIEREREAGVGARRGHTMLFIILSSQFSASKTTKL